MSKGKKEKLTDKQSRFCDEYMIDLNATQAAIRAGYSLIDINKIEKKYYVYFLIDPRDNKIFYIGKGKNNRVKHHVLNSNKTTEINNVKKKYINEIKGCNMKVIEKIFSYYENEIDAYCSEKILINKFKEYGLTNISNGIITSKENSIQYAKNAISNIKSYSQWALYLENNIEKQKTVNNLFINAKLFYYEYLKHLNLIAGGRIYG